MKQFKHLVLFDGYCNFCNSSVNFLIRHDKKRMLRYTPLQSGVGKKIRGHFTIPAEIVDSIILVEDGKAFKESEAILKICKLLGYPYKILAVFSFIPQSWRDGVYRWIAKNRYKWFGKQESCRIPTEDEKELFITYIE